jgi:ribose transport system ATP-binding protein
VSECVLEVKGINKHFGPTHANRDVSLKINRGELVGLAGENGSGKSTLISIITGIYGCDSGEMLVNGKPYAPHSPLDAAEAKIGFVVQELGLVDDLPVAINMFLGRLKPFIKGGILDTKKLYRRAEEELEKWGFSGIPVSVPAKSLTVEKRKISEIVKALIGDPELLILDETTQALSYDARNNVYRILEKIRKERGTAVLMVTHDLEEMVEISDRIAVLRDGAVVNVVSSEDFDLSALKRMMVGRMIGDYYRNDSEMRFDRDHVVLDVEHLANEPHFRDVSFQVHKGEIFGICGLSDGGIHEVGETIFGVVKKTAGSAKLSESGVELKNATISSANRVAYVPKDRDRDALMLNADVNQNLIMPSLKELEQPLWLIRPSKCKKRSTDAVKRFNVKTIGINQVVSALSGGNKQKISIGRWLSKDLDLLIMDCPTRGVDVSVKAYIYHLMEELKSTGLSMILISDELSEVIGMSDRLMIMKNGNAVEILERGTDISEEKIIEVMI